MLPRQFLDSARNDALDGMTKHDKIRKLKNKHKALKAMKKTGFINNILWCVFFFVMQTVTAQVGFGTEKPSKAAVIDMQSTTRGILIPRVALQDLTSFAPIIGESATDSLKVNSLLVYNTATVPAQNISPGFYYWTTKDGVPGSGQWHRLIMDTDTFGIEPWYKQGTTQKATQNTDSVYISGNVAIGSDALAFMGSLQPRLYVDGPINAGTWGKADTIKVGENTLAVGQNVEASGKNAVALGYGSVASAYGAFAGGGYHGAFEGSPVAASRGGLASGKASFAFGDMTLASADYAVAMGRQTKATGIATVSLGRESHVKGDYSFAVGRNNIVDGYYASALGRQLNINSSYVTALGRYNMPFSTDDVNIETWEADDPLFVIGNGTGATTNRSNAVTVLKNGNMALGMAGTDMVPTQQLDVMQGKVRVRDLPGQTGDLSKSRVVIVDSVAETNKGVLSSITVDKVAIEPWYKQGTTQKATQNTDHIYQQGNVAIGKTSSFITGATLDVMGAIRGGSPTATGSVGTNSIAVGKNVTASGAASAAFGKGTLATQPNETVVGRYNKNVTNALFAVGNGTATTPDNALTVLENGWVGIGVTQPSNPAFASVVKATLDLLGLNVILLGTRVDDPHEKLRVDGTITTKGISYPDYVFKDYFGEESVQKTGYQFKSLNTVKSFIKKYKHLPGILPAWALNRAKDGGYEFNITRLSVKSLEKIEELYLYTIQQHDTINALQTKVTALQQKNVQLQKRLDKIEKTVKQLVNNSSTSK